MKSKFFYYTSNIKSLPKGLVLFIILLVLILIPVILSFALLTVAASLIFKSVTNIFLPNRTKKMEYSDYEIVELKEEGKYLK